MQPDQLELDALRTLFQSAPETEGTRWLAIAGSLALAATVLWLVRSRGLREEYTPIWISVAFGLLVVSFRMDWLIALTRAIGAWTPSSTLFFLGEVFLVVISLNYAVRLSRANLQIKNLAQDLALLRERVDRLGEAPRDA